MPQEAVNSSKKSKKSKKGIILQFVLGFVFFLTVALFSLTIWYNATFEVKFNDFLITLLSPLSGTDVSVVNDILKFGVLPAALSLVLYGLFIFFTRSGRPVHCL